MVVLKKRGPIRLELSPETDTAHAVAVTIRPIGQVDIDVASAAISTAIAKMEESESVAERYGIEPGASPPDALRMALRVGSAIIAIELGIRHIVSWEGVMQDDDVTVVPVEPGNIAMLFNEWAPATATEQLESYCNRFMRRINGLATLEPGAKKGSGALLDTASAAAPKPAGNVESQKTPAPPADA